MEVQKKVAIIGNMNNNGLSLLRYFLHLGYDSHLFMFKGDGKENLRHFSPQTDTWHYSSLEGNIHETSIQDGVYSLIPDLKRGTRRPNKRYLKDLFVGYDFYIGSGIAPAVLSRIGIRLDIFYPYSLGIEHYGSIPFIKTLKRGNLYGRITAKLVQAIQRSALLEVRNCICGDMSETQKSYKELGIRPINIQTPLVYNYEEPISELFSIKLREVLSIMESYDFCIVSHVRMMWVNKQKYSTEEWSIYSKNNDWLIRAFSQFLEINNNLNVVLILIEFGPDVAETKELILSLGLQDNIIWVPTLDRREILVLIQKCDCVAGEFYRSEKISFGGAGWETIAMGKPLIHGFLFEDGEFEAIFKIPEPPIFKVVVESDILRHLLYIHEKLNNSRQEKNIKAWFDTHAGVGLARKWASILESGFI
jgi:glycosyltransferase involved in cell wall biosynthesis